MLVPAPHAVTSHIYTRNTSLYFYILIFFTLIIIDHIEITVGCLKGNYVPRHERGTLVAR